MTSPNERPSNGRGLSETGHIAPMPRRCLSSRYGNQGLVEHVFRTFPDIGRRRYPEAWPAGVVNSLVSADDGKQTPAKRQGLAKTPRWFEDLVWPGRVVAADQAC